MLTILGGLAALWLLLLILGVVGLVLGLGIIAGWIFKLVILYGAIYVCVKVVFKMLGWK